MGIFLGRGVRACLDKEEKVKHRSAPAGLFSSQRTVVGISTSCQPAQKTQRLLAPFCQLGQQQPQVKREV